MFTILKSSIFIRIKQLLWIVNFLLFPPLFLFSTSAFACSMAFQQISPEQFKDYLISHFPNRKTLIQELNIKSCGPHCLYFHSNRGKVFKIEINPSITKPDLYFIPFSKTLKVPSMDWLTKNLNYLNMWLEGHEILLDTHTTPKTKHKNVPKTVLEASKKALNKKQRFLHITHTSTSKTPVMIQVLKEKLQNYRKSKISFVTTHKTRLADQLFDVIQAELKGMDVTVIKWNEDLNTDFSLEIKRSIAKAQPTVFVITSQSLKSWLGLLQHDKPKDYARLVQNTDGIYIEDAYYLSVFYTKSDLSLLQEKSGAFLYVTTATSAYKDFTDILIKKGIISLSKWKEIRRTDSELKHFSKNLYIFYTEWSQNGGWEYVRKRINEAKPSENY